MKKITLLFSLLITCYSFSQLNTEEKCISYIDYSKLSDANISKIQTIEAQRQAKISNNRITNEVYSLPIVVHVVYWEDDESQNISDAQINSQIDKLNEDFRKQNSDFLTNTPEVFQPLGADIEIEFCLAQQDPEGNSFNGINRVSTYFPSIGNPGPDNFVDSFVKNPMFGGVAPWDPEKYINIWVCEITGIKGYSSFTYNAPQFQGIVVNYKNFGNIGTVEAPYDKGRTLVHEMGHYFDLYHLWSSTTEYSCDVDDLVEDTPLQVAQNIGCPTFPLVTGNTYCEASGENGMMFMNYMDYTDDACMSLFTEGQKTRIRATLDNQRASLKTSTVCQSLSIEENQYQLNYKFYPNPAKDVIEITSKTTFNDAVLEVYSLTGKLVMTKTLKKGLKTYKLDVSNLASGIYLFKCQTRNKTIVNKIVIE